MCIRDRAKAAIKAALADEDSRYHSVVTFFMEFHRDDVGPDIEMCIRDSAGAGWPG